MPIHLPQSFESIHSIYHLKYHHPAIGLSLDWYKYVCSFWVVLYCVQSLHLLGIQLTWLFSFFSLIPCVLFLLLFLLSIHLFISLCPFFSLLCNLLSLSSFFFHFLIARHSTLARTLASVNDYIRRSGIKRHTTFIHIVNLFRVV